MCQNYLVKVFCFFIENCGCDAGASAPQIRMTVCGIGGQQGRGLLKASCSRATYPPWTTFIFLDFMWDGIQLLFYLSLCILVSLYRSLICIWLIWQYMKSLMSIFRLKVSILPKKVTRIEVKFAIFISLSLWSVCLCPHQNSYVETLILKQVGALPGDEVLRTEPSWMGFVPL